MIWDSPDGATHFAFDRPRDQSNGAHDTNGVAGDPEWSFWT